MGDILDSKDRKILDVLKSNADFTSRQIAKKTFVAVTTVFNRIKKLKSEGIIKKFTVELDNKKIGKGFMVYIEVNVNLPLLKSKGKSQLDIQKEIKKFDFVERADIIAGGADLMVVIRVKDVEEYEEVLLKKLHLIEGIENTKSLVVISEQD
ncbi:Lrp/AsnC family transcriptional regulator [Candidatus Woesearchaeota archaeon]|nr:Lrp/AsnC family transcriptional regulator [Candidatus Woesearchaeota archaeon]